MTPEEYALGRYAREYWKPIRPQFGDKKTLQEQASEIWKKPDPIPTDRYRIGQHLNSPAGVCMVTKIDGDNNTMVLEASTGEEFEVFVADDGALTRFNGMGSYTWKPNVDFEKMVVEAAIKKLTSKVEEKIWGEDPPPAEALKNIKENLSAGQVFPGLDGLEAWGPGTTTFADASKGLTIAGAMESFKKVYSDLEWKARLSTTFGSQGLVSEAAYRVYGKDHKEPSPGPTLRTRILKVIDRAADIDDDTIVATVQKVWDGEMEYRLAREDQVHNLDTSLAVARHRADWMADALQDKDERIKKLERELGRYLAQDRLEGRL